MKIAVRSVFMGFLIIIILKLTGCSESPTMNPESGVIKLNLTVLWDSRGNGTEMVKVSNAKIIIFSEYGEMEKTTDSNGILILEDLPPATYSIMVYTTSPNDSSTVLSGCIANLLITQGNVYNETIYVKAVKSSGVKINELYVSGSVNSIYYAWDQFVELYNASDSTIYLDGCMLVRMISLTDTESTSSAGTDYDNDGDIEKVNHVSRFPGNPGDKNIPLGPKSFLVIAMDAIDHSRYAQNAMNLSNADWEFYNQYSPDDIDNPDVPNLLNMQPSNTRDFNMPMDVAIIILTNGQDTNCEDGIDISTIIDGVEYDRSIDSTSTKSLDPRIDKGHFSCPAKYSGQSMQRRRAGFDTDNGLFDWEILNHPTPGRQ